MQNPEVSQALKTRSWAIWHNTYLIQSLHFIQSKHPAKRAYNQKEKGMALRGLI